MDITNLTFLFYGYSAAWINGRLDIILTNSPTDPNSGAATPWIRLEKTN